MLEPDASIDTRLTNGLLVRDNVIERGGFIVRNGQIAVDDEPNAAAWRTVDASGFYVLPALIQPGLPAGEHARRLALGGIGTTIVTLEADSVSDLASELSMLATTAAVDYVVVWRVPSSISQHDATAARELDVATFEICERGRNLASSVTWRLPIDAGLDPGDLENLPGRVILTTADPERACAAAREAPAGQFIELSTTGLGDNATDWSAVARLDGRVLVTGDSRLLPRMFEFAVSGNGMAISQVARLTSTNVAAAYGIERCKRGLAVGADADVVVFDAAAEGGGLPGRAVFSLQRGEILLYNDELHTAAGAVRMLAP